MTEPDEDETDFTAPESWRPIELTSYLDGTHVPPKTGLLYRTDGIGLFYPSRVHWLHGESESGKSWVAQITTAEVLTDGGRVLYADFESTPDEIVSRLLLLGVSPQDIAAGLAYVQPLLSSDREPQAFSELLQAEYDTAVIDGVNESLGLYGAKSGDTDDVTTWGRKLPRRIARETGAAVLCIDHVTKSEEGRGRFAIGSQAKLALLDGAAYTVEPKDMAPGQIGNLVLRVAKDRAGQVRANSGPFRAADRTQETARIRFDSTDPKRIKYAIEPFASFTDPDTGESTFRPTRLMERVSRYVHDNPGKSKTDITTEVSGNAKALRTALELLVSEHYITATDYVNRGKLGKKYESMALYIELQDPKSDHFLGSSETGDCGPVSKTQGPKDRSRAQEPQTGVRTAVKTVVDPSPELGKQVDRSESLGHSDQDQDRSGTAVDFPRSTSDQQNGCLEPAHADRSDHAGEARTTSPTDTWRLSGEPVHTPTHLSREAS